MEDSHIASLPQDVELSYHIMLQKLMALRVATDEYINNTRIHLKDLENDLGADYAHTFRPATPASVTILLRLLTKDIKDLHSRLTLWLDTSPARNDSERTKKVTHKVEELERQLAALTSQLQHLRDGNYVKVFRKISEAKPSNDDHTEKTQEITNPEATALPPVVSSCQDHLQIAKENESKLEPYSKDKYHRCPDCNQCRLYRSTTNIEPLRMPVIPSKRMSEPILTHTLSFPQRSKSFVATHLRKTFPKQRHQGYPMKSSFPELPPISSLRRKKFTGHLP